MRASFGCGGGDTGGYRIAVVIFLHGVDISFVMQT